MKYFLWCWFSSHEKINWHRVNCVASRCSSFVDCSRNVFKHSNVSQRFLFIIERREDQSKANVNFHKKSFNIMALIKDVYLLKKAERREKGVCCMLVIFCNYQINSRSICFSFLFVFTNFLIHLSSLAFTRKVALKAVRNIFFSLKALRPLPEPTFKKIVLQVMSNIAKSLQSEYDAEQEKINLDTFPPWPRLQTISVNTSNITRQR